MVWKKGDKEVQPSEATREQREGRDRLRKLNAERDKASKDRKKK